MHLSFHVYGLKARAEQDHRGSVTVAVRFQEFGTHHTFVARFRDPARFVEMVRGLEELVRMKGWDIHPPEPRADTHTDLNDARREPSEGSAPCAEEEEQ